MKYKDRTHAKRKYKQAILATVATMSLGVSALGGSTSAFAEEKKTEVQPQSSIQEKNVASQGREIQGYLFQNGVQTPVYKEEPGRRIQKSESTDTPGLPVIPANPAEPLPKSGSVVSKTGVIGSVLYFAELKFRIPASAVSLGHVYLLKAADGTISEIGTYDDKTLERTPLDKEFQNLILENNPSIKSYFSDTKLKQTTAYRQVENTEQILPNSTESQNTKAVKYGLTNEDTITAGLTLGVKAGAKAKAGVPGIAEAELSMEVSTQFQTSYTHKWSVSKETTTTQSVKFPGVKNKDYKYDKYRIAQYQLRVTYAIEPGSALQADINAGKVTLANDAFTYNDDIMYLAVTPGAGTDSSLK
ncbi:hypothetical protein [Bacillus thuringiensis]